MSKRERRTARRQRERQRQQLDHLAPVVVDAHDDEHERALQRAGETA